MFISVYSTAVTKVGEKKLWCLILTGVSFYPVVNGVPSTHIQFPSMSVSLRPIQAWLPCSCSIINSCACDSIINQYESLSSLSLSLLHAHTHTPPASPCCLWSQGLLLSLCSPACSRSSSSFQKISKDQSQSVSISACPSNLSTK